MEEKISDYKVIEVRSVDVLNYAVAEAIKAGFQPLGNAAAVLDPGEHILGNIIFIQTMVK